MKFSAQSFYTMNASWHKELCLYQCCGSGSVGLPDPDPDPLVRDMGTDPSIIKQK